MEKGFDYDIINKNFLLEYYTEIKFNSYKITKIDEELLKLINLETLHLSHNKIEIVENIPNNLKELSLFSNQITGINVSKPYINLLFLGLGYNCITDNFTGNYY